jgi:hypothetical protein
MAMAGGVDITVDMMMAGRHHHQRQVDMRKQVGSHDNHVSKA